MASDEPIQELKHDAVPGYPRIFWICFAAMGLYLAIVLLTSPGQVKKKYPKAEGAAKIEKTEQKK